jgi:hypothetical protein
MNKYLSQVFSPGYDAQYEDHRRDIWGSMPRGHYEHIDRIERWRKYTFKVTDLRRIDKIMELDYTKDVEAFLTRINYLGI